MPVDIRSFFAPKKKGSKKADTPTPPTKEKPVASTRRQVAPTSNTKRPKAAAAAAVTKPPIKKKQRLVIDDSDDDDDFVASEEEAPAAKKAPPPAASSPRKRKSLEADNDQVATKSAPSPKKVKSPPTTSRVSASTRDDAIDLTAPAQPAAKPKPKPLKSPEKKKVDPPLTPTLQLDSFDTDSAVPECMAGYTFVFTGNMPDLGRDDAQDFVKILGGRVTGSVSSKTSYLVVGDILEDGRPYQQGKKYQTAVERNCNIVMGAGALYGLAKQYHDKAIAAGATAPKIASPKAPPSLKAPPPSAAPAAAAAPWKPPAAASLPVNPYARSSNASTVSNPYAKKNPYAKRASAASSIASSTIEDAKPAAKGSATVTTTNMLWVDKYKPTNSREILGNQESVRKLSTWLSQWEQRFNNSKAIGKSFSNPNGPWKAALLSGPPGIGKTTTATLVARESGRDVIEFNASDVRSKKALQDSFGDITGSRTIEFTKSKSANKGGADWTKRCIIMDEVDGMGAGDRAGMAELIQLIKKSQVPIICICNDRQSQKMKSLLPYCMDLRYRRPVKSVIARRAVQVAAQEGLSVETNAAEAIADSCGNDVRQVLNCLQMWASDNKESRMTYKSLKDRERSINKDEILRVSLFDAARSILEGRKGLVGADAQAERDSFFKRNDAFFVDYNFVGLLVQQNYLKVVQSHFNEAKRSKDPRQEQEVLERMHSAADSMSEFAHVESSLRGEQNWSLLPFMSSLAVKTGYHAGGERGGFLPGFPEFTTWLGRNSSRGKKVRMLQELKHHMNFKISGGNEEMRMSYLPVIRERILSILLSGDGIEDAITLMDDYGLDRDDVFEKLDEFKMDSKGTGFSKLDSKSKAAFTRAYNQGAHTSQALVREQGGGKKPKRASAAQKEATDLDAIDDDAGNEVEEEEENDDDQKAIEAFRKKGRKAAAAKAKKTKGKKK